MKVRFDSSRYANSILVAVSYSNVKEAILKEGLYKKILFRLLNGKPINLVTIAPQDYSIGYEIAPYYLKTIDRTSFLINEVASCDFDLIEKIVSSEEFSRTLLIIVENVSILSDEQLSKTINLIKNESVNFLEKVIFCDDDGESLLIYNGNLTIEELNAIAKSSEL